MAIKALLGGDHNKQKVQNYWASRRSDGQVIYSLTIRIPKV